jgi:glycerophosphoryl diester phosphodiesterase
MHALAKILAKIGRQGRDGPIIVAHRGASRYAPENTLTAFDLAVEHGADAVELDVRVTGDGGLVVIHDERLGRTVGDMRLVSQVTTDEVTSLDAGAWLSSKFKGDLVPLLEEALDTLRGRAAVLVEIKDGDALGTYAAREIASLLKSMRMGDGVVVISRHEDALEEFARFALSVPCAGISLRHGSALEDLARYDGSLVWRGAFTEDLAAQAESHDKFVAPWVAPNEQVAELARMGASAVLTDDPKGAVEVLETEPATMSNPPVSPLSVACRRCQVPKARPCRGGKTCRDRLERARS